MATATETTVTLAYTDPEGGLPPYVNTLQIDDGDGWRDLIEVTPGDEILVENLDPGTEYSFRVKTRDSLTRRVQTVFSNVQEVETLEPLPTLLESDFDGESIIDTFDWYDEGPAEWAYSDNSGTVPIIESGVLRLESPVTLGSPTSFIRFSSPSLTTIDEGEFGDDLSTGPALDFSRRVVVEGQAKCFIGDPTSEDINLLSMTLANFTGYAGGSITAGAFIYLTSDGEVRGETTLGDPVTTEVSVVSGEWFDYQVEWDPDAGTVTASINGEVAVVIAIDFSYDDGGVLLFGTDVEGDEPASATDELEHLGWNSITASGYAVAT